MKTELGIKTDYSLEELTKVGIPRKSVYRKGITMTIRAMFGGYQCFFESKKGNISAVFHRASYGKEKGLWEIMPSKKPKSWKHDNVKGHLTFQQVIGYVNKLL